MTRKDIHKDGVKTQFKKGHPGSVNHINKPWAYRKQLQYLAAQTFDIDPKTPANKIPEKLDQLLRKLAHPPKKSGQNTLARLVAVRMIERVIKKMDPTLVDKLIENTEGKLVQPNINADIARLEGMSEEEINAESERIDREIARLQGSLEDREDAPAEGDGASEGKTAAIPAATDTE